MRRSTYFALFLTLAAASATGQAPLASSPGTGILRETGFVGVESEEAKKAREFQKLRISGVKVNRLVRKVRKLKWHSSLYKAKQAAKRQNKPILWIQALGNLNSYT